MDENLVKKVWEWLDGDKMPDVIWQRRTPRRVMEVLHIANDAQAVWELIPSPYHWTLPNAAERCQQYLKITAVGLTYAHYMTDGFSAAVEFPDSIIIAGKREKRRATCLLRPNKIVFTPQFMLDIYTNFSNPNMSYSTDNEKVLGVSCGSAERGCLMLAIEEGLHAALEIGPEKESLFVDYRTTNFTNNSHGAKGIEVYRDNPAEQKIQAWIPKIYQDFGFSRIKRKTLRSAGETNWRNDPFYVPNTRLK